MKSKSLSSVNPYLSGKGALERHARNVASSTAIETGRPIEHYIARIMSWASVPDQGADYLDQPCFSRVSETRRSRKK